MPVLIETAFDVVDYMLWPAQVSTVVTLEVIHLRKRAVVLFDNVVFFEEFFEFFVSPLVDVVFWEDVV